MNATSRLLRISFAYLSLIATSVARADQSNTRDVKITSPEPIVSAYALIVADSPTKRGDSNTREVVLEKLENDRWKLTVNLKPQDLTKGVRYTAVAVTKSGRVIPTAVQWVIEPDAEAFVSVRCTEDRAAGEEKKLRSLSKDELETLLQIRQTRAEILGKKLRATLDIQAVAQLTGLEKELGLSYPTTLSKDLPLGELAYRIAVIESILKSR